MGTTCALSDHSIQRGWVLGCLTRYDGSAFAMTPLGMRARDGRPLAGLWLRTHVHVDTQVHTAALFKMASRASRMAISLSSCNPPPVPARKTQCSGATFRRAVLSAKEVPGAQFLSPRAQTHLPFGCSVVGVMWKPKASLNLQKKISSLGLYMVPGQQYVRTCRWSNALV
jgi:hypothetical protein